MENITLVRKALGGTKVIGSPRTELDFIPIIRAGFPFAAFTAVSAWTALSDETICKSLRFPKRTAARRKASSARLKAGESESLLRLARVSATAVKILGNKDKSRKWLLSENRALNGQSPIDLLDTDIGFQNVLKVLTRIEFGVYS